MDNMGNPIGETKRQSQVQVQVDDFNAVVESLAKTQNELIERLVDVTRTGVEEVDEGLKVSEVVPLATVLRQGVYALQHIDIKYKKLIERLEL